MASNFLSSSSNSSISSCSLFFGAPGSVVLAGFFMAPFDDGWAFDVDGGETLVFGVAPFEATGLGILDGLGGDELLRSCWASIWA